MRGVEPAPGNPPNPGCPRSGLWFNVGLVKLPFRLWFCAMLGLAPGPAHAAELTWLTDLPRAQAQAKAEKKMHK